MMRSMLAATLALATVAAAPGREVADHHVFETTREAFTFGLEVLVVGMGAVFLGLMAIYAFLVSLKRLSGHRRPKGRAEGGPVEAPPEVTTEVAHAIALALWMDLRVFDEEEAAHEITVRKVTRPFSPWWNAGRTETMHDKVEIFRKWG